MGQWEGPQRPVLHKDASQQDDAGQIGYFQILSLNLVYIIYFYNVYITLLSLFLHALWLSGAWAPTDWEMVDWSFVFWTIFFKSTVVNITTQEKYPCQLASTVWIFFVFSLFFMSPLTSTVQFRQIFCSVELTSTVWIYFVINLFFLNPLASIVRFRLVFYSVVLYYNYNEVLVHNGWHFVR